MGQGYNLKLSSKKLKSGKFQVKFWISSPVSPVWYGYLLAESGTSLKEVVKEIEGEVKIIEQSGNYNHARLYNLVQRQHRPKHIIMFNEILDQRA